MSDTLINDVLASMQSDEQRIATLKEERAALDAASKDRQQQIGQIQKAIRERESRAVLDTLSCPWLHAPRKEPGMAFALQAGGIRSILQLAAPTRYGWTIHDRSGYLSGPTMVSLAPEDEDGDRVLVGVEARGGWGVQIKNYAGFNVVWLPDEFRAEKRAERLRTSAVLLGDWQLPDFDYNRMAWR